MKTLRDLIGIPVDLEVTGITDDSREVKPGNIFVATKGFHVDHYDYLRDAIRRGALFFVVDREIPYHVSHIIVGENEIDDFYKELCIHFYDVKLDELKLIGITGTDGKTTTATLASRLIQDAAYLGTNGLTTNTDTIPTHNTTPCVSELYQDFHKIQEDGLTTTVMEVSSEALLHNRVSNLKYEIVAFTNITGDHLNVHGSFQEYVECKMKLLKLLKKGGSVLVNGDDPNLKKIKHSHLITFGFGEKNDYVISNVKYLKKKTKITLVHKKKTYEIESPFLGEYNVYNVVLAFLIALTYGVSEEELLKKIPKLGPIPGRMEFLDFGQDYKIVLDYAHTIHGIESVLDAFQKYSDIIVVTGAAGGREHEKRGKIGKIVLEKSTTAIFTMDDPRHEDVDDIIDQLVGDAKDYIRIQDREEAIFHALDIAKKESVVLILGKGRDNYMAIGDEKVPYNDYDVVSKYFQK